MATGIWLYFGLGRIDGVGGSFRLGAILDKGVPMRVDQARQDRFVADIDDFGALGNLDTGGGSDGEDLAVTVGLLDDHDSVLDGRASLAVDQKRPLDRDGPGCLPHQGSGREKKDQNQ